MACNMTAINITMSDWTAGGDGKVRGGDPNGYEGYTWNPTNLVVTKLTAVSAPVLTAPNDANVTKGATYQGTVVRTQDCHFSLIAGPDDATINPLTGQVTWNTNASDRSESMYFGVRGENEHGSDTVFWLVHYGITAGNVKTVGSGKDYATLTAAFAAMNGTVGFTVILDDGTYDSSINHDNHIYRPDYSGTDLFKSPSAGDVSNMNTVMARTPYGVVYDCRGVDSNGIYLHGNTDLETYEKDTLGWNNGGSLLAAGTDQRYVKVAGFVVKDAVDTGIYALHTDHIHFQYCGDIDSGRANVTANVNVSNISFQNSTDCLGEYLFAAGDGRYKFTTYQAKRCIYRRGIQRNDHFQGSEPIGGVSLYRAREQRAQNIINIDSKPSRRFVSPTLGGTAGAFGCPSTGEHNYPQNVEFQRCVNINSALGFAANDGYDQPNSLTSMKWTDCVHWDTQVNWNNINQPEGWVTRDGPMVITRLTSGLMRNDQPLAGDLQFLWSYRSKQTIADSIFYRIGWNGTTTEDQGAFAYSNYADNPIDLIDSYRYDMGGPLRLAGDATLAGYTETNVDTATDPTTIGMEYLGRVESGSQLETEGRGANNTFKCIGKQGTFYGETGFDTEYEYALFPKILSDLIAPHFRAYSYTGTTIDSTSETLDGDRGFAQAGESLEDYILSYTGKTPYPSDVQALITGGDIEVSWKKPAVNYITNITGWKVYVNGTLAATVDSNCYGVNLSDDGAIIGVYDVTVVATDSVTGDSGHSTAIQVMP